MAISKVIYKSSAQDSGTVWMDATTATATAADIIAPLTAMLANGVVTVGTGSGGGGGLGLALGNNAVNQYRHCAGVKKSAMLQQHIHGRAIVGVF